MPLVNYSAREITCKLVYYGPGRSGKTTNLQHLHAHVPAAQRGEMVSLATEGDRTLFFDFLPLELGTISGFRVRLQLYTVPGQAYYDATRKLVLQGADGVVFVADSRRARREENVESFRTLHHDLLAQGADPRSVPICLQYNKRDLDDAMPLETMDAALNFRALPRFAATAARGDGVFETLHGVSELVLRATAQHFARTPRAAAGGVG